MQKLSLDLFSSFKDEFYSNAKQVEFSPRVVPFYSEDLDSSFYIVLDGRIRAYRQNVTTLREQTLFIYRRGDMLDVVALLGGRASQMLYETMDRCTLLEVSMTRSREWLNSSSEFREFVFRYVASKIKHLEDLASQGALFTLKERLVMLLRASADENDHFNYAILEDLSNSEVASLLGSVRSVLERSLKELESDGVVESKRRHILIKDLQKLLNESKKLSQ